MKDYGKHLGLAFQLVDDVLDYQGDAETMGKNVGDDLAEGKTTLPLIHAMAHGAEAERRLIRQAIRKGGLEALPEILEIVSRSGAIEYTMNRAREQAEQARQRLATLPDSEHKTALLELTRVAVARAS